MSQARKDDELVTVYYANREFDGIAIRDLLDQAGIPCMLRGSRDAGGYFNVYFGTLMYGGEVQVFARDAEKATELIAGFHGTLGMLEEVEPERE